MFVIWPSMGRSVRYDMKSFRLTQDAISTIFNKLGNAKLKRISGLRDNLNRKRVNRVILGANNIHIQAQCVDLSITPIQTQTNTN